MLFLGKVFRSYLKEAPSPGAQRKGVDDAREAKDKEAEE